MARFSHSFSYFHKSKLLSILKRKLQLALREEDNFLLYVRNPLKVLVLLIELLNCKLKMTDSSSHLSYEARLMTRNLSQLATRILKLERSEEKSRLALTDTDLEGRDVLTIICENNEIELLEHKYVEKLADEMWDGPFRVERSPFWLCTSALAIEKVFCPSEAL